MMLKEWTLYVLGNKSHTQNANVNNDVEWRLLNIDW